jgi:hypothetical protein
VPIRDYSLENGDWFISSLDCVAGMVFPDQFILSAIFIITLSWVFKVFIVKWYIVIECGYVVIYVWRTASVHTVN